MALRQRTLCPGKGNCLCLPVPRRAQLVGSRPRKPHALLTHQTANGNGNGMPSAGTAVPSPSPPSPSPQPQEVLPPPGPAASTTPSAAPANEETPSVAISSGFQLRPVHVAAWASIFVLGAIFAAMTLQFTKGLEFTTAVATVARRVAKSVAFRQLVVIGTAILVLRYGLNRFLMALSKFSSSPVQWDKTKLFYILREVYQPLELLLIIAAVCTVSDAYVPSLIGVPRATVSHVVKCILSTSFIAGFASVVFNLKSRFCKENAWQAEMKGDVTTQRRWEAYDKLGTFVIYVMTFVLGIQALGLEVTSVLAIGGIGGLAIGLAGREICENLLNGFLIMSTSPFEVGDEITFIHNSKLIEGIVIDIGWYRTNLRSFEREVYVIPNAVFSKNIVLNVSRKNREWRFYEMLSLRVQDVKKANAVVQDIRRIVRNDTRVINKLHRRIFLDRIAPDEARIYMSFYLEAANRDAFMAIKQDLLVSFVDCVERNNAKLAQPRTVVDMDPEVADVMGSVGNMMQGLSVYAMAQNLAGPATQGPSAGAAAQQWVLPPAAPVPGAAQGAMQTLNSDGTMGGTGSVPAGAGMAGTGPVSAAGAPTLAATVQPVQPASQPLQGTIDTRVVQPPVTVTVTSTPAGPPSAAAGTTSTGASTGSPSPAKPGGASSSAAGTSSTRTGSTPAAGTTGTTSGSSSSTGSSSSQSAGSGTAGTAPSPSPTPSAGTRVGDVYTAPQSTLVVSVPATGVPIAFAGSVSNNVVTATIPITPVTPSGSNGSSSSGASSNGSRPPSSSQGGTPSPTRSGGPAAQSGVATATAAGAQTAVYPAAVQAAAGQQQAQQSQQGGQQPQSPLPQQQQLQQGGLLHRLLRTVASIVFESP